MLPYSVLFLIVQLGRHTICRSNLSRKRWNCDVSIVNRYIISDASIVYYIAVTAASANRNSFLTLKRCTINQRKPRVAMRGAIIQKKEQKKNPAMSKTRYQKPTCFDAEFAIKYQTASPVYCTLHSLQSNCVSLCRKSSV